MGRSLSEWGNQEYELAADRLNLTHRWIFFGSLAVSKIVQLVVNIEKQISCLKVFISSFSGKIRLSSRAGPAFPPGSRQWSQWL